MGANETPGEIQKTWGGMREEQIRLYARELAALFHHEHELRQELLVKNGELQKRIQELTALNAMFQKHLDMRHRTQEAFQQFTEGITELMDRANQLVGHARSLAAEDRSDVREAN